MSEPDHKPLLWIVDDSPLERLAAQRALAADYELEELVDGAEVIERLERGSTLPTLILLDWVMPNLSGDEVCKYLRSHEVFFDVPIVLFTASRVETADIVQGLALGANVVGRSIMVSLRSRTRSRTSGRSRS